MADRLKQACEWQAVQWDDRVIGYQVCNMMDHSRLQLLQTLRKKLASTPCRCADLMTEHPVLHNTLGHIICRDREQWEALISGPAAAVLAGHARQAVIPSQADVVHCVDATCQAIADISITGGRTTTHASEQHDTPAVGEEEMAQERTKFPRICESHFQRLRTTSPQLVQDQVEAMTSHLHDTGFRGGCWDKRLFKMYGTCFVVEEAHALEGLTLGGRFTIWGWGDSDREAKLLALDIILERARSEGILSLAEGHNLGHPKHQSTRQSRAELLVKNAPPPNPTHTHATAQGTKGTKPERGHVLVKHRRPNARYDPRLPSAFSLMKWKTNVVLREPVVKWRDVFAFTSVVVQSYSKLVGRCLRLLVNEMYITLDS